jgi:arsenate reductase
LELLDLIATMGITVRDVLRQKGDAYDTLNARFELNHAKWDDEALLSLMLEHPILINRPIVVTPKGTRLCRPSEAVLDLLPTPPKRAFIKEDGIVIFDDQGQFVAPKL